MSSYMYQNFQLFIVYNCQFDHVVLKRLPTVLNPIFDFLPSKKPGKCNFWGEEFFRMSSYICQNFHLFIVHNFQFDHVVLKRVPTVLSPNIDFFRK